MAARDLDVVVFGATGVTGRRVAEYLAERAPETGASWAAAARDPAKVERLLGEAGVSAPEIIAADVGDPASLAQMASRAKVVLDLVGPYTRYGRPVIEACVAEGAHYADLTGEIPFARQMVKQFHDDAEKAGVKIVEICGFEALPADLAVLLALETAGERWGEGLRSADLVASMQGPPGLPRPSDMISGGTLQSLVEIATAEESARTVDPAALITDESVAEKIRSRSPIPVAPRRGPGGAVIAPMAPSAFINPAVIHRSAALLAAEGDGDFQPFRYREGLLLGGSPATLPLRFGAAGMLAGGQAAVAAAAKARPAVRRRIGSVLGRVLPDSGFGPTRRLDEWKWRMSVEAETTGGNTIGVEVDAEGHPGYLATARMLGEAGLLMAEEGATPKRAGCITPATALGGESAPRFERAKVRFSVS